MERGEATECRRQRAPGDLLDHAETHCARQARRRQALTSSFLELQQATRVAEQHLPVIRQRALRVVRRNEGRLVLSYWLWVSKTFGSARNSLESCHLDPAS
jgi:hypothetical protein